MRFLFKGVGRGRTTGDGTPELKASGLNRCRLMQAATGSGAESSRPELPRLMQAGQAEGPGVGGMVEARSFKLRIYWLRRQEKNLRQRKVFRSFAFRLANPTPLLNVHEFQCAVPKP